MEIEDNHRTCKRSPVGNGKLRQRENRQDDDEDKGEVNNTPMRPWHHPSSRIFCVSRASGGKDRHSKVYTSKGLRDRRVRLSVSIAIQFYDLQDRLGYDQPSKAIEWLIKAASSAIAELPSLDTNFPEPLKMERPMLSDSGVDPEVEPSYNQQQHSSTSETSKGSVLSLPRCENRIKARERARERAKDKEKDKEETHVVVSHHQSLDVSLNSQGPFTKLLTGGSNISGQAADGANFIQKQVHNLLPVTSTADYLGAQSGLFSHHHEQQQEKTTCSISSVFSSQAQFGNGSPIAMATFSNAGGNENSAATEKQPYHFFSAAAAAAAAAANRGDYNLNFSISPGLAGFNRGTLQTNTTSHHHHHQLSHHHHHQVQAQGFSASMDGPSVCHFSLACPLQQLCLPPRTHTHLGSVGTCSSVMGRTSILSSRGMRRADQNPFLVFFLLEKKEATSFSKCKRFLRRHPGIIISLLLILCLLTCILLCFF